jgi:hypothetical protein
LVLESLNGDQALKDLRVELYKGQESGSAKHAPVAQLDRASAF